MDLPGRIPAEQVAQQFDLSGKVALISGGGGALGSTIARGLAIHGADVAVADFSATAMQPVTEELQALGRKALALTCDVVYEAGVQATVDRVVEEFGRLDILVTAAGISNRIPTEQMPVDEWQRMMDVNVRGTFLCCQKAGIQMIAQGGGKIITIGSVRGFQGNPGGYSGYTTSKGAVLAMTREIAVIYARRGIRANALCPGPVLTPLLAKYMADEEQRQRRLVHIPMGRFGEPHEIANGALFLASDESSFMTGQSLLVDGGITAAYTTPL